MMDNKIYKEVMVETMMVETLMSHEARFNHLLSSGLPLQEVVTLSRAMKLLVDKALDQVVQQLLDSQENPHNNDSSYPGYSLN